MTTNTTSLLGHWVHIQEGEYGRDVQITMAVGPDHYLVRTRMPNNEWPTSSQIMMTDDFRSEPHTEYRVEIFDTEEELDTWLAWMITPDDGSKPRIVSITKPTEKRK